MMLDYKAAKEYIAARPKLFPLEQAATVMEIGNNDGVAYFSQLTGPPERAAAVHLVIWNRRSCGNREMLRHVGRSYMKQYGAERLFCEIPVSNRLAILCAERIGFVHVGIIRLRTLADGSLEDTWFGEIMSQDLED